MVAESHRVLSFSKLIFGTGTTVAVGRPDNKQNRCKTVEELNSSASKEVWH